MSKYDDADLSVINLDSNIKADFITDNELIAKYTSFIAEDKTELLPKDIFYYEEDGEYHFYKNKVYSDEEIAAKLDISKANSLSTIASCLKFFVGLTLISIIILVILFIIMLAK